MAVFTPYEKRQHFESRRRYALKPAKVLALPQLSSVEIERAARRIRDEVLCARKCRDAHLSALLAVLHFDGVFKETARSMSQAAKQHRKLFWFAAFAAVRELGILLAGANGWEKISHDEAGCELDQDQRRLLEWLCDVGLEAMNRRTGG